MEDELEKLKPAGPGPEMERWNVEDLEASVAAMKAEIAKVEAIIAGKGSCLLYTSPSPRDRG